MSLLTVLTTVNTPTQSVISLCKSLAEIESGLIVVGDSKGPDSYVLNEALGASTSLTFLSLNDQLNSCFSLARSLPTKHYSRKNVGYLQAVRFNATCIYETDDDNAPLNCWTPREEFITSADVIKASAGPAPRWVNVYSHFSQASVWPRGIPLDQIHAPTSVSSNVFTADSDTGLIRAPIQQGLVNGSPDVDAIWRLTQDREFTFDDASSVLLPPGNWCPFNTQTTWWWPIAYPLLYIPSHCSFRMCDIWKSFVAQRCLWELGLGVVFHAPEVYQDRNVHNLMTDFKDEVSGYLQNHRIAEILEATRLSSDPSHVTENLIVCYEALVREQIFPAAELKLVQTWVEDLAQCQ